MKRFLVSVLALCLALVSMPAFAAPLTYYNSPLDTPNSAVNSLITQINGSLPANAYTVAVKDAYVLQTPTAAATNTLIDATGLTGQTRTITNGSATYTITVSGTGASGSTIVGSTAILPNTTAVFTDQLVSASAGGNQWVRTQ